MISMSCVVYYVRYFKDSDWCCVNLPSLTHQAVPCAYFGRFALHLFHRGAQSVQLRFGWSWQWKDQLECLHSLTGACISRCASRRGTAKAASGRNDSSVSGSSGIYPLCCVGSRPGKLGKPDYYAVTFRLSYHLSEGILKFSATFVLS